MGRQAAARRGFTIVELLIVIVVIAILAAIAISSYGNVQRRARDAQRMSDVSVMRKALDLYRIDNGAYPPSVPNPGNSTWEYSKDPGFLSSLGQYTSARTFKDPGSGAYYYKTFSAGAYGCPSSQGPYYVIKVDDMEAQLAKVVDDGGQCPSGTLCASLGVNGYCYYKFLNS